MERDDRRSMSPGREKRVRLVPHRDPGKLSTKSPRLTSKGDRTLRDLLRDFATDKRAFINTSTILVDLYLIPIKARKILNDRELEEMFCNIRQIIAAEQQALKVIEEELHDDEADVIGIIKGMLGNLNFFGAYCRNLPKAMSLLVRCRKTLNFVDFEKNRLQASTLGLNNLLSYPFEQIKRYDRILADWVPFFRSTELYPEFEVNRSRILDYIDDLRREVDGLIDKQKVLDVIATIDPSSINGEMHTATTTFVKEGVVQVLVKQLFIPKSSIASKKEKGAKVKYSKKPEEALLYLFTDSILVLKRKKNKNSKKKKAIELYDNKLLVRIPLATSRFIVVSDATSQKVLQFIHEGLSYAFLFDNERTWRDWQKKIKVQVKESMKKKIQKDKDHPDPPKSAKLSKRGADWGKKYHTMVTPQQPVVKREVDEVPKTPRNSDFQSQTMFQFKHRTTSFNSAVLSDVKVISPALDPRKKYRDSTFEVFLRPRAFTIASTEYSIVPESFPVVEEPDFGTTSFNSLKWAKVLNVEVDSPMNSPLNSPTSSATNLMSPRISEMVKKFSSDLLSPRSNENNTNVSTTNLKTALSLPLSNTNVNPIDALSPRSLSSLYRPESISPRGRNQVTSPTEKLPAAPPRPSVDVVEAKPDAKNSLEVKTDEVRANNSTTELPGAKKLLGRSGSIMIGGRANTINSGSNSSSNNSTPKISPRSVTDPSLNVEAINDAGNGSASVSSPSLARGGWTRVASSGNIVVPVLWNKNLKNSDEQAREAVIGTRGSGSPRIIEGNNTNVVVPETNDITTPLKTDIDNFDYDPDWQFGFTQEGRLYYYNTKLNQRTWERPKSIMPNPILDDVNAPHNWREMFSPQGYVYYLNTVTKQTSWFRTYLPAQHAQLLSYYNSLLLSALHNKRAEHGATSPLASPKSPREHVVDAQWKEVLSPDGRRFYFNELTQTASWSPPNASLLNLTALSQTNSIFSLTSEDEKKAKRKKSKG